MGFRNFDIGEFYPTPKNRKKNAKETDLHPGDVVRAKVGPVSGQIGFVVVERNGNYKDSEPYVDDERIGVGIFEQDDVHPTVQQIVKGLSGEDISKHNTVRWFDSPDQLEVVERASKSK